MTAPEGLGDGTGSYVGEFRQRLAVEVDVVVLRRRQVRRALPDDGITIGAGGTSSAPPGWVVVRMAALMTRVRASAWPNRDDVHPRVRCLDCCCQLAVVQIGSDKAGSV
jgi:hypothetical protein